MKKGNKGLVAIVLLIVMGIALAACSSKPEFQTKLSTKEMADQLGQQIDSKPAFMDLEAAMMKEFYHMDPALLEQFTVRAPMIDIQSDEVAVLKVKDAKDLPTVEAALKKRSEDIQKNFADYLPEQAKIAKNYKLVVKGNYVLFAVTKDADKLEKAFGAIFEQK